MSPNIHPDDFIFRFLIENKSFTSESEAVDYFFFDGQTSAKKLKSILEEFELEEDATLLEFASGYGCVTRHFKAVLPKLDITVSDIHTKAHEFAQSALGVKSLLSNRIPEKFMPGQFDCVFALSFFSHMPPETWKRWLATLWAATKKGGILVFTTQGLLSAKFFDNPTIPSAGIWFKAESEQKDLDVNDYGHTLVTENYVRETAASLQGLEHLSFKPGFWWDHQDLYILKKG